MKKTIMKKIVSLLMGVLILGTLFATTALADETVQTDACVTASAGGSPVLARMDPNRTPIDADQDKPHTWRDDMNKWIDFAIDVGSNFVPCGGTLVNYIKGHSRAKEKSTGAETVINAVGDAVNELVPWAEPVVAVASNVVTSLVKLIFYKEDKTPARPGFID